MKKIVPILGLAASLALLPLSNSAQSQNKQNTLKKSAQKELLSNFQQNKKNQNKEVIDIENESHEKITHMYVYDILKKCNNNREKATNIIRKHIIIEVNNIRKQYNLPPLKENEDLGILAQRHAEYMQKENHYSHTTKDGTTFAKRAYNIGLRIKCMMENIDRGSITIDQLINNVWMKHEGHRMNILEKNIDEIGTGCVFGEKFDDTSSIYRTIDGAKLRNY